MPFPHWLECFPKFFQVRWWISTIVSPITLLSLYASVLNPSRIRSELRGECIPQLSWNACKKCVNTKTELVSENGWKYKFLYYKLAIQWPKWANDQISDQNDSFIPLRPWCIHFRALPKRFAGFIKDSISLTDVLQSLPSNCYTPNCYVLQFVVNLSKKYD